MRPLGIVIQLDELEYFLPGLYPGVVLAIDGKLPFRGLEERLRDGVVVRAALAGKRLDEPAILVLPTDPQRPACLLDAHPMPAGPRELEPRAWACLKNARIFLVSRPPCGAPRSLS